MDRYDTIIIGAGHNGLVCAAYLARGGQRVLVLEAADTPGGLAAAREFHPGFKASVAHTLNRFPAAICNDLDLAAHGFESPATSMPTIGLGPDGAHLTLQNGSIDGCSAADSNAYCSWRQLMQRFASALEPFWLKPMPRIGCNSLAEVLTFAKLGFNIRRLGKDDMRELLRIASLPARDLMDEYFENDLLKAVLSWDGIVGSKMAPRSPNGAVLALLYRMAGPTGLQHRAGASGLVEALAASASSAGAEIRCAAAVSRVCIDGSPQGIAATGVQLANGDKLYADRVVSAADPRRTFLDLVGVNSLDIGFTNRIRRLRSDGYVGKLHLALDGLPEFTGLPQPDGRMIIAAHLDAIEFAFDDAKYGHCSDDPVLEIVIPSLHDASVAPDGQHLLSAHVMYVPYRLRGGWTTAVREAVCERAIDAIARYSPGIRQQIIGRDFLTPADLEDVYGSTGGHWHHGEFSMDQMLMMRPTYDAAQYRTPIPGLYLCSAGCHPGGDLTGAPGHNAAQVILG